MRVFLPACVSSVPARREGRKRPVSVPRSCRARLSPGAFLQGNRIQFASAPRGLVVFLSWRRPNLAWQGSLLEHVRCCRGCRSAARIAALGHFSGAPHPWRIPAEDHCRPPWELLGHHAKLFFWPSPPQRFSRFRSQHGPALAVAVADPACSGRCLRASKAPGGCGIRDRVVGGDVAPPPWMFVSSASP